MTLARPAAVAGRLALLAAAATVATCTGVLGLDDYRDAVAELCQCDTKLSFLGQDCARRLGERLASATAETRAAWLAYYAGNCAGSCERALGCYAQPGTCARGGCALAMECCGYGEGALCVQDKCTDGGDGG
ncbi:MAG: hypothetical protein HY744_08850 [Deltaproteobacteria bacterium]|nr:hypothetical protein [Deltaproteobacteria bacterium]